MKRKEVAILILFFLAFLCVRGSFYVSDLMKILLVLGGSILLLTGLIKIFRYFPFPDESPKKEKNTFLTKEMYEGMVRPRDYALNGPGIKRAEERQ
jgi:hypothetical protein